jgi:protein CpxP
MKLNLKMPVAGALLIVGSALPLCAYAQSPPPTQAPPAPPQAAPPAPAQAAPPAAPGANNPTMEDRVGKRITQLHAALKITADEETQWKQFADVMLDNARKMDGDYKDRAAKFATLSAVDNMQSYADIAEEHAEDVKRLVTAFQPLYAAMPDAQKKIADQVFRNAAAKRTPQ